MSYEILEEFTTTGGITWQKRKYESGKVVYRNSKDFRVNRKQQAWASASKHKVDTSNEQIGPERESEIFDDDFHHRIVQASDFYGDFIDRMEEWYQNEPEIPMDLFQEQVPDKIEELEEKIQKTGKDEPGWPDEFDRYHYYVKYLVVRDGAIYDESRRYTQALDSLEELELDFQGVVRSLVDIASGYDNILVIEWGIQGKVIQ